MSVNEVDWTNDKQLGIMSVNVSEKTLLMAKSWFFNHCTNVIVGLASIAEEAIFKDNGPFGSSKLWSETFGRHTLKLLQDWHLKLWFMSHETLLKYGW